MLLALDTSAPLGSVAVGAPDGEAVARRLLRRRRAHAAELVPAVRGALDDAGISRSDLEGVVVGAGPGSFTGVRVAAATAKGLVRALEVPLFAVSSLAAGAVTAGLQVPGLDASVLADEERERPRCVLFDARADRVYTATYRIRAGRIEVLAPPRADRIDAVLDELRRTLPVALVCGSGALRHRERWREAGFRVLPAPAGTPTADALLRILALEPPVPPVEDPGRWEPEYLRPWRSDAGRGEP